MTSLRSTKSALDRASRMNTSGGVPPAISVEIFSVYSTSPDGAGTKFPLYLPLDWSTKTLKTSSQLFTSTSMFRTESVSSTGPFEAAGPLPVPPP